MESQAVADVDAGEPWSGEREGATGQTSGQSYQTMVMAAASDNA
jgi:hypothetical protein